MIPAICKFSGTTANVDRPVEIGEELLMLVECEVVAMDGRGDPKVELAVKDGYEAIEGPAEETAQQTLAFLRSQFLARQDERRGRHPLPLDDGPAPSATLLDTDESGVVRTPTEAAEVDGLVPPPHPDDDGFEAAVERGEVDGVSDPGPEPFPDVPADGPDAELELEELPPPEDDEVGEDPPDRTDQVLAEQHFAEESIGEDEAETVRLVSTSSSVEPLARIPRELMPKIGRTVRRVLPAAIVDGKVDEIRARLEHVGSVSALETVEKAETTGKGRKGVLEAIGRRAGELSTEEPPVPVDLPDVPVMPVPDDEPDGIA